MAGDPSGRGVLAATIAGSSMAFIDATAVGVALPTIQAELGASPAEALWVSTGYLLFLGSLVLLGGAASDRFGRRRLFLLGIIGFVAASVVCAVAPSPKVLIAGRALQGAAAAVFTPASLAILGASFDGRSRGAAIGTWAGVGALLTAAGPVLGGVLASRADWRLVFWLNLPLAVAAVLLTRRYVAESKDPRARGLDLGGALTASAGLMGVTWALTVLPDRGLDRWVALALAGGVAGLALFLFIEARAAHPMMPLHLFRVRAFAGTNALTFLLYAALGATLFFLPFEVMRVRGHDAAVAGASMLPFSVVMGLFSRRAGRLADARGPRLSLSVGPVVAGIGMYALSWGPPGAPYVLSVVLPMLVLAAGMTLAVGPLTATVMGSVEVSHAGVASGVNNAVSRVGSLLAVAALGLLASDRFSAALGGPTDGARAQLEAVMAGEGSPAAVAAFHAAFGWVALAGGLLAVVAGVVGYFSVPGRPAEVDAQRGSR